MIHMQIWYVKSVIRFPYLTCTLSTSMFPSISLWCNYLSHLLVISALHFNTHQFILQLLIKHAINELNWIRDIISLCAISWSKAETCHLGWQIHIHENDVSVHILLQLHYKEVFLPCENLFPCCNIWLDASSSSCRKSCSSDPDVIMYISLWNLAADLCDLQEITVRCITRQWNGPLAPILLKSINIDPSMDK